MITKAPPIGRSLLDVIVDRVLGPYADIALRDRLLKILLETAIAGGTSAAEQLGIEPTLSIDAAALRRLVQGHTPAIVGINETTRNAIREALYDVLQEGGDLDDQVSAVRDVFRQASRARAVAIARTESGIFWHAGGRAQGEEAGAHSHTWLATRDPRVREAHRAADGQCRPIDQPYEVGGEPLMHPCDPGGSPGNIINCRCTETFSPYSCASKTAKSYDEGTRIWKRVMRSLAARERLALVTMRRVFRDQRVAVVSELQRLAS